MVEEKKAEKNMAEKEIFQHLAEYANDQMLKWAKLAESRSSGHPVARAYFSPLGLDSANFTV
jgi:hypothetical protein